MRKIFVNKDSLWTRLVSFFLISVLAVILVSCAASGNKGTLQRDQELNQMILASEVLPNHKYYFSGSSDKPNAILGIHEDYQLISQLWNTVQISSAQLAKWIATIAPEDYRGPSGYIASYILDPDGKKVGIWYSIQKTTTVEFLEGNKIKVNSPDLYPPWELETPVGINLGS
jgi:hypothetical protein